MGSVHDRQGGADSAVQAGSNTLRQRIETGKIPPGRRIPSLVELEEELGVARDTLRKAVKVLKEEGLVETVVGMGVYVVQRD
ncbi:GntR family transcriptional regulator [Nonomuraea sp. NBC_00507]|uniref:GntR family transcriptional regulator n=1 Tax=Nonomuraea sp. NBC_00507 TaxID=2976002 RepID=UPI002E16ED24